MAYLCTMALKKLNKIVGYSVTDDKGKTRDINNITAIDIKIASKYVVEIQNFNVRNNSCRHWRL